MKKYITVTACSHRDMRAFLNGRTDMVGSIHKADILWAMCRDNLFIKYCIGPGPTQVEILSGNELVWNGLVQRKVKACDSGTEFWVWDCHIVNDIPAKRQLSVIEV